MIKFAPLLLITLIVGIVGVPQKTLATILVSGTINSDTTWIIDDSPYIISGVVTIASEANLTIDSGVVVKFIDNTSSLTVSGSLAAIGNSTAPIIFTSYADDANDGDTNGDGHTTIPMAGDWKYIRILSGATANLDYTTIQYGGSSRTYAMFLVDDDATNVTLNHSTLQNSKYSNIKIDSGSTSSISNNVISNTADWWAGYITGGNSIWTNNLISSSGSTGLYLYNASPTITNNTFARSEYGLYLTESSSPVIANNMFIDNTYGLASGSSGSPTIINNTFSGNTYPIYLATLASTMTLTGNTGSGNTYNVIELYGITIGDYTLNTANDLVFAFGNFTVSAGTTLTVAPGQTVKFLNTDSTLTVAGNLNAIGTSLTPIVFTSINDDASGGDTNGDGSASAAVSGDWQQIIFQSGSLSSLDYTIIRYGSYLMYPMIDIESGANFVISNSEINHSYYGLSNADDSTTVLAESNWWGSSTGPYNATTNPTGTGNTVSNNVDFTPWLTVDPAADITPPAEVTLGTSHNDVWNKTITLNWTNPTDADFSHVRIDRTDVVAGTTTTLSSTETGTSYNDTTLSYNLNYTYTLYTIDTTGNTSTGITTTSQRVRSPAPTNLALTAGNTSITATWTASSAPASTLQGYKVYYGTSPTALTSVVTLGKVTTTTLTGLTNGTRYYVAVTAFSKTGLESPQSVTKNTRPHP